MIIRTQLRGKYEQARAIRVGNDIKIMEHDVTFSVKESEWSKFRDWMTADIERKGGTVKFEGELA